MNFACDRCQKRYSIADEKVQGRGFRVTCKQCGHVIVVRAVGQAAPHGTAPRPAEQGSAVPLPAATRGTTATRAAPSTPTATSTRTSTSTATPTSTAPSTAPSTPTSPPPWISTLAAPPEPHDEHEHFFNSEPAHRPRAAAEWLVAGKRRPPALFASLAGLAVLLVAGGVALSRWSAGPERPDPPPAPLALRGGPPAPPAPTVLPALAAQAEAPAPVPESPPAELPPEPALPQKGALRPRGAGGRAGFEPAGGGGGGGGGRDRPRRSSLTIGKTDRRLLDLLGRKGDAAPAAVERTGLDTARGSLDEATVRQTLAANANGFAACVTRAVKADPHLTVNDRRATLNLTVKPSGLVSSAWISEADLDRSPLGLCLLGTARRMVFPAFSGEALDVAAPLSLSTTY